MAGHVNQSVSAMALLALLVMVQLDFTVAQIGICYGMLGDNLPPATEVVALYKDNNITRMRIFTPDIPTLQALANSDIELIIGVLDADIPSLAASVANALTWVQTNIKSHPDVKFRYIGVGNEISPLNPQLAPLAGFVLPAMQNLYSAISAAGLSNQQIRVSPVVETGLLGNSFPPAAGAFRSDVASYINPIVAFLAKTGSPLLVNVYPYFAYINNKAQIDIGYALFQSQGVDAGGVRYQNLFYAIVDAVYAALEKSGGSGVEVVVSETGWPTAGGDSTSVENARIYNTNLVQKVKIGTPKRPGKPIETYIFDMIDEDKKNPPEYERHWGLFYPNKEAKYPIQFN